MLNIIFVSWRATLYNDRRISSELLNLCVSVDVQHTCVGEYWHSHITVHEEARGKVRVSDLLLLLITLLHRLSYLA